MSKANGSIAKRGPVDITRLPRGTYRARCAMVDASGFGRTVEAALDDLCRVLLLRDRAKQQLARQAWRPEDVADTVTQAQLGAPYARLAPGPQPRALTARPKAGKPARRQP